MSAYRSSNFGIYSVLHVECIHKSGYAQFRVGDRCSNGNGDSACRSYPQYVSYAVSGPKYKVDRAMRRPLHRDPQLSGRYREAAPSIAALIILFTATGAAGDNRSIGELLSQTQTNYDRAAAASLLRSLQIKSGEPEKSGSTFSVAPPVAPPLPTSLPLASFPAIESAVIVQPAVANERQPEMTLPVPVFAVPPVIVAPATGTSEPAGTVAAALPAIVPPVPVSPGKVALPAPVEPPSAEAPQPDPRSKSVVSKFDGVKSGPSKSGAHKSLAPKSGAPKSGAAPAADTAALGDWAADKTQRKLTRAQCGDILARAQLGELTQDDRDLLRGACRKSSKE